ncbi:probable LRR receptor-like serine/threonine-protein kinase At1g67720 [Malania oleifera]|uniref:probable LRR receptor-like serine/threonine-protein kinase At1g67720 n=1 Tax=Malania oleifera TaxID=397392 RepID=UPI0025AE57CD|nr:probable LRR receptor-like serine/threonine-protein kinase At1g67720 [Malania oleifera]
MTIPFFLLCLFSLPLLLHSLPAPRGFLLSCGSSNEIQLGSQKWVPDEGFISIGKKSALKSADLLPTLATVRYFPDVAARKYCYAVPVTKGGKYLVRTTYYYGGFDGGKEPPVFDQIVDGTKWSTVNTTEDYANGLSSYYEIVVAAQAKTMSVCLARNNLTASSPFISALEVIYLEPSMYNSTDFGKYALTTVARHSFGSASEDMISFPDDQYNRFWQPFNDDNPTVTSHSNVTSTDFWNIPPLAAFETGITTSRGKALEIQWPPGSLPAGDYYVSLYFQDNRTPSPYSWRVFDVSINGENFYGDLNVSTDGVNVYSTQWPLSGATKITMTPNSEVPVGPVINAGEVLQILPLGGRTLTRDVMAMEDVARSLNNPPSDWRGDPCLPSENSWTGVKCSYGKFARIITLNLTGIGISGSLSPSIANLTALTNLWLGGNNISGPIPELKQLTALQTLHLENNKFEGSIPQSFGSLAQLHEIFLQNNNLQGTVPAMLQNKKGLNVQVSPGNLLSTSATKNMK